STTSTVTTTSATSTTGTTIAGGGSFIRVQRYGNTASDQGYAVATDSGGNIIIGGSFNGTVDFGAASRTSAGGFDAGFIAKYTNNGSPTWVLPTIGGTGSCRAQGLAVDRRTNCDGTGGS